MRVVNTLMLRTSITSPRDVLLFVFAGYNSKRVSHRVRWHVDWLESSEELAAAVAAQVHAHAAAYAAAYAAARAEQRQRFAALVNAQFATMGVTP